MFAGYDFDVVNDHALAELAVDRHHGGVAGLQQVHDRRFHAGGAGLGIHRGAAGHLLPVEPGGTAEEAELLHPMGEHLESQYQPKTEEAEVGHCVHRIAMHPSRPDVLFMQKHWDVMRSDNAGDNWREVSGNLRRFGRRFLDFQQRAPPGMRRLRLAQQQRRVTEDAGQRVVEIQRH